MISHRSLGRYDDLWGPAVLCVVLVVALIVSVYFYSVTMYLTIYTF